MKPPPQLRRAGIASELVFEVCSSEKRRESLAREERIPSDRWTLLIVREILCGSRRFNDILGSFPASVLSERLQALVFVGAIARTNGSFTYEGLSHGSRHPRTTIRNMKKALRAGFAFDGSWKPSDFEQIK